MIHAHQGRRFWSADHRRPGQLPARQATAGKASTPHLNRNTPDPDGREIRGEPMAMTRLPRDQVRVDATSWISTRTRRRLSSPSENACPRCGQSSLGFEVRRYWGDASVRQPYRLDHPRRIVVVVRRSRSRFSHALSVTGSVKLTGSPHCGQTPSSPANENRRPQKQATSIIV